MIKKIISAPQLAAIVGKRSVWKGFFNHMVVIIKSISYLTVILIV
jgi:hypothetical protein